jgi:hypothetical protein
MASTEVLRSVLRDVALEGAVVISKRKLLWLLGWGQDRKTAWGDLLVHWKHVEPDQQLHLVEVGDKIVMMLKPAGKIEALRA